VRFERILISVLALATVATPAWATSTTVYTDQTAFNNATSSVFFQGITFTGANLDPTTGYSDPSGVAFTDSGGTNSDLTISGGGLADSNRYQGFAAVLPSVVYDFWFTITATANSPILVTFNTPDVTGYRTSFNVPGTGIGTFFFGITSTAPITGLSIINQSGGATTLTAFDFAEPSQTPEAATLLLIGTGLILMRFFKKRDKARANLQPTSPETRPAGFVSPQIVAG